MDLAKRETPLKSQPQTTFRRETTMPRQATDLPGLEVNAQIHGADMSGAEELSRILGLANKVGQNVIGDIKEKQDNTDAAAATLDFATGAKNDERFAKSHAYRDAWQLQGAKKMAVDISTEVTEKFNARLNDPDNPPTIPDLDQLFEQTVAAHLQDEHGQPLNFITPQAKATLGNALMKLKEELMPQAAKAITLQTNTKLYATTFSNMLHERMTGQEIGSPKPDPLAPLPEAESSTPASKAVSFGKPTGQLPLNGKVTSTMADHERRGSHGVDIDGRMGDPVTAPAGGKVTVGRDARSGLFVKIDHGDGVVSSYAHLSKTSLKTGDTIQAGQTLGLVGNSGHTVGENGGDGSHLHYRIRVNGKDVNPLAYNFHGGGSVVIADGSEPDLKTGDPAPVLRPGFDVEKFMASLPPSVDKGEAKTWLLGSLIAEASSTGDTTLLNGLEDSKRKDGTPSFTPDERLKIAETRERLEDRNRIEADRKDREMKEDNSKLVLQAMVEGKPPSQSWLADQSAKGLLDANFVYSVVNHINEQAKSDAREARMEQRQTQAEEDNDLDAQVYAMEASRRAGILAGTSYQEDLQRWRNGELGTGKKAAARLLRLQAATKAGAEMTEKSPEFAYYSGQLADNFKPTRDTGRLILMKPQAKVSKSTYQAMVSYYAEQVHQGKAPGDAYREAVQKYGKNIVAPKDQLSDIRAQIAVLRAKKAGH